MRNILSLMISMCIVACVAPGVSDEGSQTDEVRANEGSQTDEVRADDGSQTDEVRADDGSQTDEVRADDGSQTDEVRADDGSQTDEVRANEGSQTDEARANEGSPTDEVRADLTVTLSFLNSCRDAWYNISGGRVTSAGASSCTRRDGSRSGAVRWSGSCSGDLANCNGNLFCGRC